MILGGTLYGVTITSIFLLLKAPARAFLLGSAPAIITVAIGHDFYTIGSNLRKFYLTRKIEDGPINQESLTKISFKNTIMGKMFGSSAT